MPISNYPHRFDNGLNVSQVPIVITANPKGQILWVNSGAQNASDGNKGTEDFPLNSLFGTDGAMSKVKDNQGDIVFLAPTHVETVIAATEIKKSGVTIIGLGSGDDRAKITFTTDVAAGVVLGSDAASTVIHNVRFLCNIDNQTSMLKIGATDCIISSCKFAEETKTAVNCVNFYAAGVNSADNCKIIDCKFYEPTAGNGDWAVEFAEVTDGVEIARNFIYGDFDVATLHVNSAKVSTNLNIHDNIIHNLQTAKYSVQVESASTGNFSDNRLYADGVATTLDPGSLKCTGNIAVNSIDHGGYIIPSEESLAEGSTFWISKTFVSSTITFATPVDMTGVSTGELAVEEVILKTDSVGLAGGTAFQVKSNNVTGRADFIAETVANLGANNTVDIENASVFGSRSVLESGKKFQVQSTIADCTGAGTVTVYIKLSRVVAGASVAVV